MENHLKSLFISAFSSSPAFIYAAVQNFNWQSFLSMFILPITFFIVTKFLDHRWQKKRFQLEKEKLERTNR